MMMPPPPPPPPPGANPYTIALRDVTAPAMGGLIQTGLSMTPIVVGNGAAIGDLDGDGLPDVVLARISRSDRPLGGPTAVLWNTSHDGQISFRRDDAFTRLTTNVQAYGVALG